jgi:phosphoserine phosphatase RsbU/P
MKFQYNNIISGKFLNVSLRNQYGFLIFLFSLIFLMRLLLPHTDYSISKIITELVIITAIFFLTKYIFSYIKLLKFTPISVIINAGIISAVLYFLLFLYSGLIGELFSQVINDKSGILFFPVLFTSIYFFIIIVCVLYIFAVLRELFFLRQLKDRTFYFNVMIVFIILASLAKMLPDNYDYINLTFTVVAIILISINSMRISWMAFLSKKEKQSLLIFSILLAIAFGLNLGALLSNNSLTVMLKSYSTAFHQFSWLIMLYGNIYFTILFFITLFHLPTAEAYDKKAEEVTSLQNLSKLITQVFDFKDLTETITDITIKVCRADAAWFTWEEDGSLKPVAVKNISYLEANTLNEEIFSKKINLILKRQ